MQTVWARILAGEVAKPGSYSLRALALVRVMSKDDADTFTRLCSMVWNGTEGPTAMIPNWRQVESFDVSLFYKDFVHLEALGLIRFTPSQSVAFTFDSPSMHFTYFGQTYVFSAPRTEIQAGREEWSIDTGSAMLTEVGKELSVIAGALPNEKYRLSVVSFLRDRGWEMTAAPQETAPLPSSAAP